MEDKEEVLINKAFGIAASIALLVIGLAALLSDLDAVASVLLILMGVGGILLVYKYKIVK